MSDAELLDYCNEFFEYRGGSLYSKKKRMQADIVGQEVGYRSPDSRGRTYHRVLIKGTSHAVHRLIFLIHNKYLPDLVDHRDGDISNNYPSNLREATDNQNQWNRKVNKNSTTGIKGVRETRCGTFEARIQVNGKQEYLGTRKTLDEAAELYKQASLKHHGEFRYD
ncbi:HNH endonuclease [Vibrio phage D148]